MNRKDFLKNLSALGVVAFIPTDKEVEKKQDDNTVIVKMRVNGKDYAIGYRFTNTVQDYKALTWLTRCAEMTLRDIRNELPKKIPKRA